MNQMDTQRKCWNNTSELCLFVLNRNTKTMLLTILTVALFSICNATYSGNFLTSYSDSDRNVYM